MRRLLRLLTCFLLLIVLSNAVMAQTETPLPLPATETPTPTITPTPTPTLTPTPDVWVWSTVPPAVEGDPGQAVVFKYEFTAGDFLISVLLFALLCVALIQLIVSSWKRSYE